MSKFKVGDRVMCKKGTPGDHNYPKKGTEYTVIETDDNEIRLDAIPYHWWGDFRFELAPKETVEEPSTLANRHIHADLIIAWANGASIQMELYDWTDIDAPTWQKNIQYRIKPEPKPVKQLSITEDQAKDLMLLFSLIYGKNKNTVRETTDVLYSDLIKLFGIELRHTIDHNRLNSLYIEKGSNV